MRHFQLAVLTALIFNGCGTGEKTDSNADSVSTNTQTTVAENPSPALLSLTGAEEPDVTGAFAYARVTGIPNAPREDSYVVRGLSGKDTLFNILGRKGRGADGVPKKVEVTIITKRFLEATNPTANYALLAAIIVAKARTEVTTFAVFDMANRGRLVTFIDLFEDMELEEGDNKPEVSIEKVELTPERFAAAVAFESVGVMGGGSGRSGTDRYQNVKWYALVNGQIKPIVDYRPSYDVGDSTGWTAGNLTVTQSKMTFGWLRDLQTNGTEVTGNNIEGGSSDTTHLGGTMVFDGTRYAVKNN